MPFFIVKGDITKMNTDAIVNAANNTLLGGGGVDGAIHRAAGRELLEECKTLGGCETGQAKITKGYNLPAKYVIHTVGPIWRGGEQHEEELLSSCYRNSLRLAKEYKLESIAFPLISSGVYGYPKDKALNVAVHEIRAFLDEYDDDMTVYMVIFGSIGHAPAHSAELRHFISKNLAEPVFHTPKRRDTFPSIGTEEDEVDEETSDAVPLQSTYDDASEKASRPIGAAKCRFIPRQASLKAAHEAAKPVEKAEKNRSLSEMLKNLDMSFSEMLFKLIDEHGMTDAECYKAANLDRRHFSKIRSEKNYHPSKNTCIALCIALRLTFDEASALLRTAGYAFTRSSKSDVIIEFYIRNRIYDIDVINEALFDNDQMLLGA